jgi:hemoglobin/transferrin/lactoferrin receptor protein
MFRGAPALCVLILAAPCQADESAIAPTRPFTLDDLTVTAMRFPLAAFDSPYSTEVVDADRLARRAYRTVPQALRDIPGVMIQETAFGQGSPFIRGFTGFRTLFLIDGIRLNNSVFREGPNQYWSTVDPLSIDRLEVVKGPSSVLYGSDAVGGTVNAVTRGPWTWRDDGAGVGGRLHFRGATAETGLIGRGELSASLDRTLGFLLGGGGKHFGDLHGGHELGRQGTTGYDEFNQDFKAEYFLSENVRVVAAHQWVDQNEVPRTHATIHAESFHGSAVGTDRVRDLDQRRELAYVQFHAERLDHELIDALHASLSWHEQRESEHRIRGGGQSSVSGFDVDTVGLFVTAESRTPIGRLTWGLEYYHDQVNSSASNNAIQGPVADDAAYDLLGLFIQDTIPIGQRVEATLGGRFTYAALEADSIDNPAVAGSDPTTAGNVIAAEDSWTAFTGSARINAQVLRERLNVFAGVSQGFRAPNLSDVTRLDIARSGELEIPSANLDAENFISFEVGSKYRDADTTAQVAFFHTDIQDMIVRQPTGNVVLGSLEVRKLNGGDGYVHGVEFGAARRFFEQWTAFGNFTWMEGYLEQFPTSAPNKQRLPLSRVMPLSGQVGLRWDDPEGRFWAQTQLVMADRQEDLSADDARDTQRIPPGGTPGYAVAHLRAGWRVSDQLELSIGVENIADVDYRVHGSGTNMPGRNFIFTLEFRF